MKKFFLLCMIIIGICSNIYATEMTENTSNRDNIIYDIADYEYMYLKGKVIDTYDIYKEDMGYYTLSFQNVMVHIKDKGYNTTKRITHSLSYYTGIEEMSSPLKKGDKVIVYVSISPDGKIQDTAISERDNSNYLLAVLGLYAVAIVIIGGKKGLKALISLILTVFSIFYIILPQLVKGVNPLLITTAVSIAITTIVLLIISGFNKKSFAAMIGTAGGILIAALFAISFGSLMHLSGISEEAGILSQQIQYNDENAIKYDFRGLLYAGIIIGALGACMDVSMSIASALHELKEENKEISFKRMLSAGMNIGKDMMGTMTNTLILAYMGSSMILVMIFAVTNGDLVHILNSEMILEEILRAIAGSFGLVATIPFTTLITSLMMGKR